MTGVPLVAFELASTGFLAGLVRGCTGFGSGLVLAPVLILILESVTAVPVMLLLGVVVSLCLLVGTTRHLITHFAILRLTALITFAMLGLLSLSLVRWLAVITPAFVGGTILGSRLPTTGTETTYRLVAAVVMMGSAIVGIIG